MVYKSITAGAASKLLVLAVVYITLNGRCYFLTMLVTNCYIYSQASPHPMLFLLSPLSQVRCPVVVHQTNSTRAEQKARLSRHPAVLMQKSLELQLNRSR